MNFTIKGVVLSPEEYVKLIGNAPLLVHNGNTSGWIKILSGSQHSGHYFHSGLVQLPQLNVQVGDIVHLAFEGLRNSARLVDWKVADNV